METALKKHYFSPVGSGGLGGIRRLYESVKHEFPDIKMKDVKDWLEKQDVYTLFKDINKKFPRLPIIVNEIDEQWQIDIMDMSWVSKYNNNFKYLLTVVDCLSRFAWVKPLKTKSSNEVANQILSIFSEGRKPKKIQSDQGKEFKNQNLMKLFKEQNINYFTSTDDVIKCAIVERFNRTLRSRLYRYMAVINSNRYIDVLNDIVKAYNRSFHRTIQMAPSSVNEENRSQVLLNIRRSHPVVNVSHKPFVVGSTVRITRAKATFEKSATNNFSEEIFKIIKVKKTPQGFIYRLSDLLGEPITSVFYHKELVYCPLKEVYKIEKVIKTKINPQTRKKEYLVKWYGYPSKFNSWVQNVESN